MNVDKQFQINPGWGNRKNERNWEEATEQVRRELKKGNTVEN